MASHGMDNFHIDITCEGAESLCHALAIGFGGIEKATHYAVIDGALVFYWSEHYTATPLPFGLGQEAAVEFVTRWLAEQNYGPQPDHDGDNGKGWRVYNEDWGHVNGLWQAFLAVKPAWAMYGK